MSAQQIKNIWKEKNSYSEQNPNSNTNPSKTHGEESLASWYHSYVASCSGYDWCDSWTWPFFTLKFGTGFYYQNFRVWKEVFCCCKERVKMISNKGKKIIWIAKEKNLNLISPITILNIK